MNLVMILPNYKKVPNFRKEENEKLGNLDFPKTSRICHMYTYIWFSTNPIEQIIVLIEESMIFLIKDLIRFIFPKIFLF
jgi:hypothetical protein